MSFLFLVLPGKQGFSQPGKDTPSYWTYGIANTLPEKRVELAFFTPSRIGLTNKIELSIHPLMFFLMPQVTLKIRWSSFSRFAIATQHGFSYPTQLLRLAARKGTGGFISPQFGIPQMVSVYNGILVSYGLFKQSILTVRAGIAFSIKSGSVDPASTIDLPIIYPRMAVYYNNPVFDPGIDFRGNFSRLFGWLFNIQNFIVYGTGYNYFMENKGTLLYTSGKSTFQLHAGYKLCYGKYPYGNQWQVLPVLELIFGAGR